MSYTTLNSKRRRKKARIQGHKIMDTIPEALYQNILGYLLGNDMKKNFRKNYELQFINKTFQRSFQRYLKTNPLELRLEDDEASLQLINIVKKYDVQLYGLSMNFFYPTLIMKAMYGVNFSSLRKLLLNGVESDLEVFKNCKELTHFTLGEEYHLDDVMIAKTLQTFLLSYKETLEYLILQDDSVPKDLRSWPKLKKLTIVNIHTRISEVIESNTLEKLVLHLTFPCRMVIKCPNLKVLFIDIDNVDSSFSTVDLDEKDDDYWTCHSSELRKIGMEVEVSDDCDISIQYDEENRALIFPNYNE